MSDEPFDPRGALLLHIARTALEERLRPVVETSGAAITETASAPWLLDRGASFVSLHKLGRLRGCVGTLEPVRALIEDVRHNAMAAALEDSRFPPVEHVELAALQIEVTLLAPRERLTCASERDAIAMLRPGIDGLLLTWSGRRATFLPQVWDSIPQPKRFLAALKEKAGLSARFWDRSIVLERYTALRWSESESPTSRIVM